mmetsp:Transcript_25532/g.55800  ORF Transcript_25532/g.55800 Transcript_25532/m.55800 type:complete len:592 (-) Transcript_25532:70-1845(-)
MQQTRSRNLLLWLILTGARSALAADDSDERIHIQGAPLVGGTNGMNFDEDNLLTVAQVYGRTISKLNVDSGEIVEQLSYGEPGDLVVFPDDLIFGSDGTMYYTDPAYYETVLARSPGGPSVPLLPIGSVPFANSVTLSDDGKRLFYGQCWDTEDGNGLFELSLETLESKTILDDIFGCASNAMTYKDGALYTPRPFEGRVVKVDLTSDPPRVTNVTTDMVSPNAVKFNSLGELAVTDTATGEVVLVDLAAPDTGTNRKVLAQFPSNYIDNLAFDMDDRLFVSSASNAAVTEILSDGGLRIVSPEGMSIPMGLAVVEETQTIYTLHPGALFQIDPKKSEFTTIVRSAVTLGPMEEPTSLVAWGNDLVLLSVISGSLMVWDLEQQAPKISTTFGLPADAHPFRGDLLVTEMATGRVIQATAADSFQTRKVIAEAPGAAFLFLAGDDEDVYVSDGARGLVLQIISQGEVLDSPSTLATDLSSPEGIAMHPNGDEILVVNAGNSSLLAVDRITGDKRVITTELALMSGIDGLPFGFPNDVVVVDGSIYVNGDGADVIYKIEDEENDSSGTSQEATATTICIVFLCAFNFIFFAAQ